MSQESTLSPLELEIIKKRVENIKKHVTIFDVLSYYGLPYQGEYTHQINCPFPENHSHGDSTKSARVYFNDNVGSIFCFACSDKAYDPIGLTAKMEPSKKFMDVVRFMEYTFKVPTAHLNLPQDIHRQLDSALNGATAIKVEPDYIQRFDDGERLLVKNRYKLKPDTFVTLIGVKDDILFELEKYPTKFKSDDLLRLSEQWIGKVKKVTQIA